MSIYDQIGVRPFINAGGWTFTRYGGSIMPEPVVAAMVEASKRFVNLFELQDQMGKAIAAMTHNESAFVSCGAASGILLSVAACIAGTDPALADRLPDSSGMRNQIIMQRCGRGTEADPAVRAVGGKIVEVGPTSGRPSADEIVAAINPQTATVLIVAFGWEPELDAAIVKAAHDRNVPVLIDGASSIPPKQNLWRFTNEIGADAFITSGGKAMRGPQSTGLVLGKRSIIDGCKFHASPNLRIGRGMKVGKEEFAGIYAALQLFLATDFKAQAVRESQQVASIAGHLEGIWGVKLSIVNGSELHIDLDCASGNSTAEEVATTLLQTDPSILLRGRDGKITVRATLLQDGEERIVAGRLREILSARGSA